MDQLIRSVLNNCSGMIAEVDLCRKWLENQENPDARDALIILEMKTAMVSSWLTLLTTDEKFVIEKHLIEQLEWPRVAFEFSQRWKGVFSRTERSLVAYQASALRKISAFCNAHKEIVSTLFEETEGK